MSYKFGKVIGRETAKIFFKKYKLRNPLEKLAHGPLVFAATGIGSVEILWMEMKPDRFICLWECPDSVFVEEFSKRSLGKIKPPLCEFLAAYSAGWMKETLGMNLDSREIWCRASGKRSCRFLIAPPVELASLLSEDRFRRPREEYQVIPIRF